MRRDKKDRSVASAARPSTPQPVPLRFQRPQEGIHSESHPAAKQERKKQRSDSSDNADCTAEVHQRPRKQDKQRQRAKDIAKVASVEPECLRLCGSIALLLLMLALCFLFHFFFSVLPPAASLEKLNCLNHGNHQHGQAQRDAVFGSAHRREAKGVGQERNLQNGGCEDKRTDHCRP